MLMKKAIPEKENIPVKKGSAGFSLIEVVIALVILMIAVLGVFAAFTYSTTYNTGNSRRSQALSVLQKEVELLRSAKFVPQPRGADSVTDPPDADEGRRDLTGGIKPVRFVTAADNNIYAVATTVDDDPFTASVQTDATKHLKEITITVTPVGYREDRWEIANQTTAVFRRVRSN